MEEEEDSSLSLLSTLTGGTAKDVLISTAFKTDFDGFTVPKVRIVMRQLARRNSPPIDGE